MSDVEKNMSDIDKIISDLFFSTYKHLISKTLRKTPITRIFHRYFEYGTFSAILPFL